MPRIFAWIAVCELGLFAATAWLGLNAAVPTGQRQHVALALFTALLACLLHAVVLTYAAVAGKVVHQAIALGALDPAPFFEIREIKRRLTTLIGAGMLSILVAVGTGAWRLSGTQGTRWHLLAGAVAGLTHAVVYYRQFALIHRASTILTRVMQEYQVARGNHRPVCVPRTGGMTAPDA